MRIIPIVIIINSKVVSSTANVRPTSSTRRIAAAAHATHLVQWIHLFMTVLTRGPRFLSSTARLLSRNRLRSLPKIMAWSCRSHSPPWSHMGQSSGWLICTAPQPVKMLKCCLGGGAARLCYTTGRCGRAQTS